MTTRIRRHAWERTSRRDYLHMGWPGFKPPTDYWPGLKRF
jgi:hypothetical protein